MFICFKTFPLDKRVENWLMMSSPMYTIYLCAAYLLFVAVGPKVSYARCELLTPWDQIKCGNPQL